MFLVMPLFGFVSAGVSLGGGLSELARPLPLAVLVGLLFGKQFGIFGAIWVAIRSGVAARPPKPGGSNFMARPSCAALASR